MRARDAVGKRIVEVRQRRYWSDRYNGWIVEFDRIKLDDGTILYATVVEGEDEHSIELHAIKKREAAP